MSTLVQWYQLCRTPCCLERYATHSSVSFYSAVLECWTCLDLVRVWLFLTVTASERPVSDTCRWKNVWPRAVANKDWKFSDGHSVELDRSQRSSSSSKHFRSSEVMPAPNSVCSAVMVNQNAFSSDEILLAMESHCCMVSFIGMSFISAPPSSPLS